MTAAEKYIQDCKKWRKSHKKELKERKPWTGLYPVPPCFTIE